MFFGIETEPTWPTLRQELMAQVNLQRLFGSLPSSVSSILVTFIVVFLYATFLLVERRSFATIVFSELPGTRPVAVLLSQNGRL